MGCETWPRYKFTYCLNTFKKLDNNEMLCQYGHKQWQAYFGRTFDIYTKLWKFQQQHRAVLDRSDIHLKTSLVLLNFKFPFYFILYTPQRYPSSLWISLEFVRQKQNKLQDTTSLKLESQSHSFDDRTRKSDRSISFLGCAVQQMSRSLPSLESMDIAVNPAGKIAGRSNLINNENSHAVSSIALWPET